MARSRKRSERTAAKQAKNSRIHLPHHISIIGKMPVREFGLIRDPDTVGDHYLCRAPLEPIVEGFPKDSQTAIVMKALKLHGAELARL